MNLQKCDLSCTYRDDENTVITTQWGVTISPWLGAHATWGHLAIGGVFTLNYDFKCIVTGDGNVRSWVSV